MTEWKTYKLGDIAEVQTGPFGSQLHNKDYALVGSPIVTVEHLGNRHFTTQNLPLVSDTDKARLSKYILSEGDIVFSRVGSVDRCSYVSDKEVGWLFSGRCLRVRCNRGVYPLYIYYYFCLESVKQYIRNVAVGATMPSINTQIMSEIPISLPSLEEQRRIAGILGAIDDKIECNRRINANLELQAQALYKQWFVNNRSREWETLELDKVAKISAGGDKPCICSKQRTNGCRVPIFSNGIDNEGLYGYTNESRILEKSITVSARGTIGFVCLRTEPYVPIVRLISVVPTKENLSAEFLYLWAITQNISGTGTTQQQLTVPDFKRTSIVVPDTNLLCKFNEVIMPIFLKIKHNKEVCESLASLRDTLLPKLMNGEIKVAE